MSPTVHCYACQSLFSFELEELRPYRDGLIQGQRVPRYWVRCPVCGQKNVIQLDGASEVMGRRPGSADTTGFSSGE